jgi:GT2 family glycosyltransferase
MELSIVTISMNHGHYLRGLCKSLHREGKDIKFEMILIDNCSSDDTQQIIRKEFPWVRLITNKRVRSFSYNNNKGFYFSRGRYFLALNPDIKVFQGALKTLISFMDVHPAVGMCGPKLLNPDLSIQPSCRKYSTPLILLLRGLKLDKLLSSQTGVIADYMMNSMNRKTPQDVNWLTGSAMMIRREAFRDIKGFDEHYPLYFEDQDLCRRMWEKGWRVSYVPSAAMIHYYARESAKNYFNKKARMHYRSMFYYLFKYFVSRKNIQPRVSFHCTHV